MAAQQAAVVKTRWVKIQPTKWVSLACALRQWKTRKLQRLLVPKLWASGSPSAIGENKNFPALSR
jgi:hypothetical protein